MTGVSVAPKTNNIDVGETRQLNVTIEPEGIDEDVTYNSDDEDVATVDEEGLVTGVGEGETTITVTVEGETDTATVNVVEPDEGDD